MVAPFTPAGFGAGATLSPKSKAMLMSCPNQFILFQHRSGAWCAAPPRFRNDLLDPLGWGGSRVEAICELFQHPEFVDRARSGEWACNPGLSAFLEVPEPEIVWEKERKPEPMKQKHAATRRPPHLRVV